MEKLIKKLKKMLPQKWENILKDPRRSSRKWDFSETVKIIMDGILSGCGNLRKLEELTSYRGERLPDTTAWDLLAKIDPKPLKEFIAKSVKKAKRNHQLDEKEDLPINLTAVDGKMLHQTRYPVDNISQARHYSPNTKPVYSHVALRAFHVSSKQKVLLGQYMVEGQTNENGAFPGFLKELNQLYGKTDLIDVLSLDFGFMSQKTAQEIINCKRHYIISLKDPGSRKRTTAVAHHLLGSRKKPDLVQEERYNGKQITRKLFRCAVPLTIGWEHAKEYWRIEQTTTHPKNENVIENFYKISSLPKKRLTNKQVLLAVRLHWNIENNSNWVMDTAWKEETSPWCSKALELTSLLRVIAYNIVALLKADYCKHKNFIAKTWKGFLLLLERILFPFRQYVTL